MHLLDVTMLHGPAVGGVSRYLSTKRRWMRDNTRVQHSQLVAAARAGRGEDGEYLLPGLRIPLCGPLRWPIDPMRWVDTIRRLRPDVIEANDVGSAAWFALAAAHKLDIPLLGFAHVDLVRFARERKGMLAERVVIGYMRAFYNRCDVVIAPSQYMRTRLAGWGIDRVVVRHLGVDATQFHPRSRSTNLRARLGLAESTRLLIYVGRFSAEKRIGVLLDSLQALGPRHHLLLVGAGDTPPLPSNVTRMPFVANTGVLARLIASADALVHAGDVETFGLVYLEAMACGRPVVAAAGGAASEIVDANCGVLARPGSPAALAEAIEALYARDIDALGANARARVEAHFTLDLSMHRLLALYRTAVAAPQASVPALVAT
ncbi:MAG: glycosyltransferase [Casimicrobiaceae bacterium]